MANPENPGSFDFWVTDRIPHDPVVPKTGSTGDLDRWINAQYPYVTIVKAVETEALVSGTTSWGHSTGVTESNVLTFNNRWTGTGLIASSGDGENLQLNAGEYMESNIVQTGAQTILLTINQYASGDTPTIKYRTASSPGVLTGTAYSTYSTPFSSSGYVQVRLESSL